MSVKLLMLLGLILCHASYGQVELNKSSEALWELSIELTELKEKKVDLLPLKGSFQSFHLEGMDNAQTPGAPSLPYYSFLIEGSAQDIALDVSYEKKVLLSPLKAMPAPKKPCRCEKKQEFKYELKAALYQQSDSSLVEIKELGDYRGKAISQVVVRPLLQQEEGVVAFTGMRLRLKGRNGLRLRAPQLKEENKKMVLVAPRHLKEGMEQFRSYKESQGHTIKTFIYEDIARDEVELQQELHTLYKRGNFPFQYALFFGYEEDIPPFKVITTANTRTPSDYPYFTLGGSQDSIPDVFYGRIVGENNGDIISQLKKIKEYDQQGWRSAHGEKTIIGIASNEGWSPSDVDYMKQMTAPFEEAYYFEREDFFQDNANSNSTDINIALNRGARWLNYIGHGSGTSWSSITSGEYHSRNVRELRNGDAVKPIIIDVACQNGRFNNAGRLGETFQTAHRDGGPLGSVAFFGGSVDISWDPPAIMAIGINESLRKKSDIPLYQAIAYGQIHLLGSYEDLEAAKENLLWYHLLGDPSQRVGDLRY